MCGHYEGATADQLARAFNVVPPEQGTLDLWPGYLGNFVRNADMAEEQDEVKPRLEILKGTFGLIPGWSKDTKIARRTYNARSETVAEKPSFRNAWRKGQHCIIPAQAIYEPDWRSGKPISTRIMRADSELMGIAGLWECWSDPSGNEVFSYTMLTVNAGDHELMCNYHRSEDEKRMVVILPRGLYTDWLSASDVESMDFMRRFPAARLAIF